MDLVKNAASIESGATALGVELGSTRIKAVLVNENCETPAAEYASMRLFHSPTSISAPGFSIPANHGHEQNRHAWLQR